MAYCIIFEQFPPSSSTMSPHSGNYIYIYKYIFFFFSISIGSAFHEIFQLYLSNLWVQLLFYPLEFSFFCSECIFSYLLFFSLHSLNFLQISSSLCCCCFDCFWLLSLKLEVSLKYLVIFSCLSYLSLRHYNMTGFCWLKVSQHGDCLVQLMQIWRQSLIPDIQLLSRFYLIVSFCSGFFIAP